MLAGDNVDDGHDADIIRAAALDALGRPVGDARQDVEAAHGDVALGDPVRKRTTVDHCLPIRAGDAHHQGAELLGG